VSKRAVTDVLGQIDWYGCSKVKALTLPYVTNDHVASLGRGMRKGHLPRLEELVVTAHATGLIPIISALGEGACPAICKLHLSIMDGAGELPDGFHALLVRALELGGFDASLGRALESGHCMNLRSLAIRPNYSENAGVYKAAFQALEKGCCPRLSSVHFTDTDVLSMQALARAITSDGLHMLEELKLSWYYYSDQPVVILCEALNHQRCPHIKRLVLHTEMGSAGARALGRLLSSGFGHQLQHLELHDIARDSVGGHHIMQAFQHGDCSHLKTLHLCSALDDQQCDRLRMAFSSGALSQLEELIFSYCRMNDEGMASIMDGLGSRCGNLNVLKLINSGMRSGGGQALARALASGSLPRLRELELMGDNAFVSGAVMAQVIRGLASKFKCLEMERISVFGYRYRGVVSDEACEALLEGLEARSWPLLVYIELPDQCLSNPKLAERLISALERGAGAQLESLALRRVDALSESLSKRLVRVFAEGKCPRLQYLILARDSSLDLQSRCQDAFKSRRQSVKIRM